MIWLLGNMSSLPIVTAALQVGFKCLAIYKRTADAQRFRVGLAGPDSCPVGTVGLAGPDSLSYGHRTPAGRAPLEPRLDSRSAPCRNKPVFPRGLPA